MNSITLLTGSGDNAQISWLGVSNTSKEVDVNGRKGRKGIIEISGHLYQVTLDSKVIDRYGSMAQALNDIRTELLPLLEHSSFSENAQVKLKKTWFTNRIVGVKVSGTNEKGKSVSVTMQFGKMKKEDLSAKQKKIVDLLIHFPSPGSSSPENPTSTIPTMKPPRSDPSNNDKPIGDELLSRGPEKSPPKEHQDKDESKAEEKIVQVRTNLRRVTKTDPAVAPASSGGHINPAGQASTLVSLSKFPDSPDEVPSSTESKANENEQLYFEALSDVARLFTETSMPKSSSPITNREPIHDKQEQMEKFQSAILLVFKSLGENPSVTLTEGTHLHSLFSETTTQTVFLELWKKTKKTGLKISNCTLDDGSMGLNLQVVEQKGPESMQTANQQDMMRSLGVQPEIPVKQPKPTQAPRNLTKAEEESVEMIFKALKAGQYPSGGSQESYQQRMHTPLFTALENEAVREKLKDMFNADEILKKKYNAIGFELRFERWVERKGTLQEDINWIISVSPKIDYELLGKGFLQFHENRLEEIKKKDPKGLDSPYRIWMNQHFPKECAFLLKNAATGTGEIIDTFIAKNPMPNDFSVTVEFDKPIPGRPGSTQCYVCFTRTKPFDPEVLKELRAERDKGLLAEFQKDVFQFVNGPKNEAIINIPEGLSTYAGIHSMLEQLQKEGKFSKYKIFTGSNCFLLTKKQDLDEQ